ncbi:MAG TPA: pentapeptide repeat-containing protein [Actinocrinis sp.]|jgi:uncharacterized protein YjbI with pentapeptide repeats
MPKPRELDDLPYACYLQPFEGRLDREGSYDSLHFDGTAFDEADGGGSRFTECAFSAPVFTAGRLRRTRFNDVWLHSARWVGTDLAESEWFDAEIVGSVLAGLEAYSAQLRATTFFNCKFDSVNLRTSTLRDVAFVDCVMRDVDFGGATLTGVTFPGTTLDKVRFGKAQMKKVDLRGAGSLNIVDGFDALRGAIISTPQLLDLAPMLADVLGITVKDR